MFASKQAPRPAAQVVGRPRLVSTRGQRAIRYVVDVGGTCVLVDSTDWGSFEVRRRPGTETEHIATLATLTANAYLDDNKDHLRALYEQLPS